MKKSLTVLLLMVALIFSAICEAGVYDDIADTIKKEDTAKAEREAKVKAEKEAKTQEEARLKDEEGRRSGKQNYKGYQNTLAEIVRVFNSLEYDENFIRSFANGEYGVYSKLKDGSFKERVLAVQSQLFNQRYPGSDISLLGGRGTFVMSAKEKIVIDNFKTIEYFLDDRSGVTIHIRKNIGEDMDLYTVTCADYKNNYIVFQISSIQPYDAQIIEAVLPVSAEISELGLGKKGVKFSLKELIRLLNVYYADGMGNGIGAKMSDFAYKLLVQPQYRYDFLEQSLDLLNKERR